MTGLLNASHAVEMIVARRSSLKADVVARRPRRWGIDALPAHGAAKLIDADQEVGDVGIGQVSLVAAAVAARLILNG